MGSSAGSGACGRFERHPRVPASLRGSTSGGVGVLGSCISSPCPAYKPGCYQGRPHALTPWGTPSVPPPPPCLLQEMKRLKRTYMKQQSLVAEIVRKDVDREAQKAVCAVALKIDHTVEEVRSRGSGWRESGGGLEGSRCLPLRGRPFARARFRAGSLTIGYSYVITPPGRVLHRRLPLCYTPGGVSTPLLVTLMSHLRAGLVPHLQLSLMSHSGRGLYPTSGYSYVTHPGGVSHYSWLLVCHTSGRGPSTPITLMSHLRRDCIQPHLRTHTQAMFLVVRGEPCPDVAEPRR